MPASRGNITAGMSISRSVSSGSHTILYSSATNKEKGRFSIVYEKNEAMFETGKDVREYKLMKKLLGSFLVLLGLWFLNA